MFEQSLTVLIVEADDPTRVFVAGNLTADGLTVLAAAGREHAAVRARHDRVDLVVLGELGSRPAATEVLRDMRAGRTEFDPAVSVLRLTGDATSLACCERSTRAPTTCWPSRSAIPSCAPASPRSSGGRRSRG